MAAEDSAQDQAASTCGLCGESAGPTWGCIICQFDLCHTCRAANECTARDDGSHIWEQQPYENFLVMAAHDLSSTASSLAIQAEILNLQEHGVMSSGLSPHIKAALRAAAWTLWDQDSFGPIAGTVVLQQDVCHRTFSRASMFSWLCKSFHLSTNSWAIVITAILLLCFLMF